MAAIIETIQILPEADTFMDDSNPFHNFGGDDDLIAGGIAGSPDDEIHRTIMRFPIPNFIGRVVSQTLKIRVTSVQAGAPPAYYSFGVFLVDSPQDDLWIEGAAVLPGNINNGAL